jgi:hypothetical protein
MKRAVSLEAICGHPIVGAGNKPDHVDSGDTEIPPASADKTNMD